MVCEVQVSRYVGMSAMGSILRVFFFRVVYVGVVFVGRLFRFVRFFLFLHVCSLFLANPGICAYGVRGSGYHDACRGRNRNTYGHPLPGVLFVVFRRLLFRAYCMLSCE